MQQKEVSQFGDMIINSLMSSKRRKSDKAYLREMHWDPLPQHNIEEDEVDLQISISNLLGSLFKYHTELVKPIVQKLLAEVIPKALAETSPAEENGVALTIISAIIEFYGIEKLPEASSDLAQIILKFSTDKDSQCRRTANRAIGILAQKNRQEFEKKHHQYIEVLQKSMDIKPEKEFLTEYDEEDFHNARDNAIAALGKILMYRASNIDAPNVFKLWLGNLPLKHDEKEGQIQYDILVDVISELEDIVLGVDGKNLSKVLEILGEVVNTDLVEEDFTGKLSGLLRRISDSEVLNPVMQESMKKIKPEWREKLENIVEQAI